MRIIGKTSFCIMLVCSSPVYATDVNDFSSFYNLYKTATTSNDITITADMIASRLLSVPGAQNTTINGGGYNFNGENYNGFTVSNGYTVSLTNGGSFSVSNQTATVENSVNGFYQSGQGAVFANLGGVVDIQNSAFSNNSSAYGGSVVYQTSAGSLNILNSAFQNNTATRSNGGVIYNQYGTSAVIDGSYFQENSASRYGGVFFNDGDLTITNSVFSSNSAQSGAAVYSSNSSTISNVYFIGNTGSQDVGAVYTTGMMDLSNSFFQNNTGVTGGGIGNYGLIGDGLFTVVKNSEFSGNSATYGGAVYNWDDMYIIDSNFSNNSATDGGGAIFNLNALFLIAQNENMEFSGNTSSGVSNAIHTTEILHLNAGSGYEIIFDDRITGFGSIVVNRPYELESATMPADGEIVLNEDMTGFSGSVDIEGGTVSVGNNGKFFSATDLTVAGATLYLGLSNASVNSATFSSGAVLGLSVQDANTYGYLTADNFSISDNSRLSIVLNSSAMDGQDSLRLQLLRSSQTINDNFMPEINNNIYAFLKIGNGWYEVIPESTFLDVIRGAGGNQNNENTAIAWQEVPSSDNTSADEVYERLNELVQLDAIGYVHALTALAPSTAPLMQILGTSYVERFDNLLSLDSAGRQEYSVENGVLWAAAIGGGGRLKEDKYYANFDIYGYGFGLGAECDLDNWNLGIAYTYQYDRLKSWARTMHAPTYGGGIYAKYENGGFIWNTTASSFYTDLDETKNVAGVQLFDSMGLYTTGLWSEIGYKTAFYNWEMLPTFGTRYTFIHRNPSTDTAGQEISSADLNFLTTYAGVSFAHSFWLDNNISITPIIDFGGSYDWHADVDDLNVKLRNAEYYIQSERLSRWQANGGLKLKIGWGGVYEVQVGADVSMRSGYNNYSGSIKGSMMF